MKLAFTTFACPDWSLSKVIQAAVKHGYSGVEFRIDAHHEHGVDLWLCTPERWARMAQLANAGVEIACLGTSLQFIHEDVVEQLPERLKLAKEVGAPALRVLCGKPAAPMSRQQVIDRLAFTLRFGAELADEQGVELWLETHDTMSRGVDAATVVRQVNHHGLGLCWDTLNPVRVGEDLETTVAAITGLVRHVHFHDGLADRDRLVITRMGDGDVLIDEAFAALVKMGYDGYLSGEWFHDQYGEKPDDGIVFYQEEVVGLGRKFNLAMGQ
jgi:sugar phosphate isomerase/epimerase